ncbi:MAG: hypothetical protein NTAFB01_36540 [Nitrospira sp.]
MFQVEDNRTEGNWYRKEKAMRMPGFTADAALFDQNRYVANVVSSVAAPGQSPHQAVIPQIRRFFIFGSPEGKVCLGFEDYDRGMSYVAGCF